MVRLGEARGAGQEAVSCLSFSATGMLLLSGHASGDLAVWEWHRTAWQNDKHLKGALGVLSISALHNVLLGRSFSHSGSAGGEGLLQNMKPLAKRRVIEGCTSPSVSITSSAWQCIEQPMDALRLISFLLVS